MKVVISVSILLLSVIISSKLSFHYKQRQDFLENLLDFLEYLYQKVSIERQPLSKVISSYNGDESANIFDINVLNELSYMEKDELVDINRFINNFGKSTGEIEKKRLKVFIEKVQENLEKAKEDKKKFVPLYFKLGVAFGASVVLIIL